MSTLQESISQTLASQGVEPTVELRVRVEALSHACRHRLANESARDVVRNAETYFRFLQGGTAPMAQSDRMQAQIGVPG